MCQEDHDLLVFKQIRFENIWMEIKSAYVEIDTFLISKNNAFGQGFKVVYIS